MVRGIDMGMQCEGLSDGYTAGVLCLYNTGMKQLLREKTLQERQRALLLEFHGKGITRLNCCLHMLASAKEKKAAHRPIQS